ncbi:MAG TPA: hypothetical protein GX497_01465 [Bacillus bacterium]|nr:hypothetical protein [Bacillus sp. (in: firmicutes)]
MKIDKDLAVLTRAGSSFGLEYLRRLREKDIKPSLLCVEITPLKKRIKTAKFLAKKIGIVDAFKYNIVFWKPIILRNISFGLLNPLPNYEGLAEKVVYCKNINDSTIVESLFNNNIKKVVLAQSGIIREPILNIKDLWIINCHPGRLPDYRGVDVIKWALVKKGPIEVTLHVVRAGIDTGEILEKKLIPVVDTDHWTDVEKRAINTSIDLLVDASINGSGRYKLIPNEYKSNGKQYYLMPYKMLEKLNVEWPSIRDFYVRSKDNDYNNG